MIVATLVVAGCGTGGMADTEAAGGEDLFKQKCGGCHALAAAGTQGIEGPDLDAAFAAARDEGYDETSIRSVVLGQMRYPIPPMPQPDSEQMFPPSEFTEEERDRAMSAIANYVASVVANDEAIARAREQGQAASDPRSLFTSNCAGCHTFAPAGSTATIGPSLDDTSLDLGAIEQQIRRGGGGMPAFEGRLSAEQIRAIAGYVANRGGEG